MPQAVDGTRQGAHHSDMAHPTIVFMAGIPRIVGSFGGTDDLGAVTAPEVFESCDLAEIRLDLLAAETGGTIPARWNHLKNVPLLFTARRLEEGGAGTLDAQARSNLLHAALGDASLVDIEVASIDEMRGLVEELKTAGIPWIASFHDFEKLPETATLETAAKRAKDAGAHAFKAAAKLHSPADLARLADFQLGDHGIPVATMGMGVLAPVSRLLCAQCGSVLNYGYLGKTPTAPGQWDAATLKHFIARLAPFRE
jgi:3-dehydroquinate dehydratase-1